MRTCSRCGRDFPDHLIHDLVDSQSSSVPVCPPCGLALMNERTGLVRTSFSTGSLAQQLLEEARAYLAKEES